MKLQKLLTKLSTLTGAAKVRCLAAGLKDPELALDTVMTLTYAPTRTYGVTLPVPKSFKGVKPLSTADYRLLDSLADRRASGDYAKKRAAEAAGLNPLMAFIINRDLRIGMGVASINKAYRIEQGRDLIKTFKCQLAKKAEPAKMTYPVWVEPKLDGVRVLARLGQRVELYTRQGKQIYLPELEQWLQDANLDGLLDGELIYNDGATSADRSKISGAVLTAMHEGYVNESKLTFKVFDYLTVSEWVLQVGSEEYEDRREEVARIIKHLGTDKVSLVPVTKCHTPAEVNACYEAAITAGTEGIIVKRPKHVYAFKRCADWGKMKAVNTADLRCVGFKVGKGKYQGQIGALACEGVVDGVQVSVHVAGLTDEQRKAPMTTFLGKTIEVAYNSVTTERVTGNKSLFLPRFVCVRIDK